MVIAESSGRVKRNLQEEEEEKQKHDEELRPDLTHRFTKSILQTKQMFLSNYGLRAPVHEQSFSLKLAAKVLDEFKGIRDVPPPVNKNAQNFPPALPGPGGRPLSALPAPSGRPLALPAPAEPAGPGAMVLVSGSQSQSSQSGVVPRLPMNPPSSAAATARPAVTSSSSSSSSSSAERDSHLSAMLDDLPDPLHPDEVPVSSAVVEFTRMQSVPEHLQSHHQLILRQRQALRVKPQWHAPWKLMRVISGHTGWVRSIAVDPANDWFVTGSADRTIKIWDLASGTLKLTLTGHINSVRALAISKRHPYLFSAGDDKMVKCWDLEYNKVIRSYHGHLSGVYSMALHPSIDVLFTGGRDSTCRVWDVRTKANIRVLSGHTNTVGAIISQPTDPQVITGSHDSTIRCWDLATGKATSVLTNHKKSVRALQVHPREYTFASASADNIKIFKCPEGKFLRNVSGHNAIVNCLAVNPDNVLVSGGDNGSMHFWDWKTGHCFQETIVAPQPGSLDSEAGLFAMTFDMTGSRLITAETDKTIKVYKEDEDATEESHPVVYKPQKRKRY